MRHFLFSCRIPAAIFFLVTLANFSYAQEYYHYYKGRKIMYDISTEQIIVKFKDKSDQKTKDSFYTTHSALKREQERQFGLGLSFLGMKEGSKAAVKQLMQNLKNDPTTKHVSPLLLDPVTKQPVGGIGDQFIVKLKSSAQITTLLKVARQTNT